MKLDRYLSQLEKLAAENKYVRTLAIIEGIALILAFLILGGKEVVVVQQPNKLTEAITVTESTADEGYKKRWALSFAELMGNLTPANVDFVVKSMESYFAPDVYQKIKVAAQEQAETLKHEQASVSFTPKNIVYEPKSDHVFITGDQEIRTIGLQSKRKVWTYEFGIKVVNYLPVVTHYEAYSGQPKTIEVREQEKQLKQAQEKSGQEVVK
ncbi:TraE/TraK family type IV conjugative transfer system protein [Alcanivorax sp.]|uniref:TraE/TraK family type IV conjugative transfer system protein n=1 Tax=Alcanivorax sp. TaxID=1872427 RepID=UPI00258CD132|nr:TraE/TraK family type IV conjugative transfer system protein [Alcanivorax sp.]